MGGAFAGGWTSTIMALSTTIPATWNGTDLALTYINRDSNNEVANLITFGANGAITSGPFPLPIKGIEDTCMNHSTARVRSSPP